MQTFLKGHFSFEERVLGDSRVYAPPTFLPAVLEACIIRQRAMAEHNHLVFPPLHDKPQFTNCQKISSTNLMLGNKEV